MEVIFLIDEQIRILKYMSEMTGRIDMAEFAGKVGLSSGQIMQHMQYLAGEGYLKKVGGGFALTPKGKGVLKYEEILPENLKFNFYLAEGKPTGMLASSVKEFRENVLRVESGSLEFHLNRGDFENWFRSSIVDYPFADELAKIKKLNLSGEELRKAILKAVDLKYML